MEIEIPRIKKRINAFLVGEEGKISKQSLLAIGTALGTVALSNAAKAYDHGGGGIYYTTGSYKISHGHHASHSAHSSHSSHGAHSSHSSHGSHSSY